MRKLDHIQNFKLTGKMKDILDMSQNIVLILDTGGSIKYINRYGLRILEYEEDELLSRDWFETCVPLSQKTPLKRIFRRIIDGDSHSYGYHENPIRSRSGNDILINWHNVLISDEQDIRGVIGFGEDITELERVKRNLQITREEAEKAHRVKNEFLARMSHEIRTPMNAIIGFADLLNDTDLSREQQENLEQIRNSARNLLSIVNNMFLLMSGDEEKKGHSQTLFYPRELIKDILNGISDKAENKRLKMIFNVEDNVPKMVVGDSRVLQTILKHILDNSIKFTDYGEIEVTIGLEERIEPVWDENEKVVLHFIVSDTGIGMPPEIVKTIFDSFQLGDQSLTRKFGGLGLGLSISSKLVQRMGGRIWVESELDRGSTFHFTAVLDIPDENPPDAGDKNNPMDHKVLVVSGNREYGERMVRLLDSIGYQVHVSTNAEDTTLLLEKIGKDGHSISTIILDHDSGDLVRVISKKIGEVSRKKIPIIMSVPDRSRGSASSFPKDDRGPVRFMKDPIELDELRRTLDECIVNTGNGSDPSIDRTRYAILIVEDHPVNQKVAEMMLRKKGHDVEVANNGKEAIEKLERSDYDLVLMDIQMPVMDGYRATKMIRDRNSKVLNHDITIIAMTAHIMEEDREKCISVGMNGYISKPISMKTLCEEIERSKFSDP